MRRADGTLFVDSFAHGGIQYELKWDFAAAKAALEREDEAGIASRRFRLRRGGLPSEDCCQARRLQQNGAQGKTQGRPGEG